MAKPRSAEEMNRVRRAQKARQQARKKKERSDRNLIPSLADIEKHKRKREAFIAASKRNGDRLLAQVDTTGILKIDRPETGADDKVWERYDRDVKDVISAAKRSESRYSWQHTDDGFIIGKARNDSGNQTKRRKHGRSRAGQKSDRPDQRDSASTV